MQNICWYILQHNPRDKTKETAKLKLTAKLGYSISWVHTIAIPHDIPCTDSAPGQFRMEQPSSVLHQGRNVNLHLWLTRDDDEQSAVTVIIVEIS